MTIKLLECQNLLQYLSCLSVLYNYCDGPTKLFSDLNLAKFLLQEKRSLHVESKILYVCLKTTQTFNLYL